MRLFIARFRAAYAAIRFGYPAMGGEPARAGSSPLVSFWCCCLGMFLAYCTPARRVWQRLHRTV